MKTETPELIPHDFGTGSGIIKEVGKYAYKRPMDIYREAVSNALDQYEPQDKDKVVEVRLDVPPDHDVHVIDHATGIERYSDFIKAGSDEGKKVGDRISSYAKIDPEIVGQKHIGKISFIFASQDEKVEFHSNNDEVGMVLVMKRAGFEPPVYKDTTKVLPHRGLRVIIKRARKEIQNERSVIDYLSKVFAIRIARGAKISVNGKPVERPKDFDCSNERPLFELDTRDSEDRQIVVRGQLRIINKPKVNNIDIFVKHVYVESNNYDYQVEGWINVDHFELEIGRNRVYEDDRIYPEFRKKFYEYLDKNFEKTSKTVEKEIKGVKQLEEMARSLIEHFCALNPDMVQPLLSGNKATQGVTGKSSPINDAHVEEKWNVIKGVIDVTKKAPEKRAIPISEDIKNRKIQQKDERKISITEGDERELIVKSSTQSTNDNKVSIALKFVKLPTNQDDPVIYYQQPNRIVINTARSSSGIILSGNPKDPQRKAMVLPLLSMAIIDMFPSAAQLTAQEWKRIYGQLLDKGWASG